MNVRHFCAPRLRELFGKLRPAVLAQLNDSPAKKPLTIKTTFPGLSFDFNAGLRLQIPAGNWHVKIFDADSQVVCFDEDVSDTVLISLEKFFVRWEFLLWLDGQLVFGHSFNAEGWRVHVNCPFSGMGDRIVLFPYIEEFRRKWNCRISCNVEPYLQELLRLYFPEIEFADAPEDSYATYLAVPGFSPLYFPDEMRKVPMTKFAQQIFGLACAQKKIYRPTKARQISEPYVCIAVQTSSTVKTWLNPDGWPAVVDYLKRLGYRVLCIDRDRTQTDHGFTVTIPDGAEDFTGDLPLSERVNLLAYAEFFVGLPSGLSWLAWAADVPVVLIGGITASWFEFSTPYRVVNRLVCCGCHNDTQFLWPTYENCPRHAGTERAYECSRKISARQVIDTIDRLLADKRAGRFVYANFL